MAITLYQLGRYVDALDACESALEIDPNQARFHYSKGNVLMQIGRIEEAQRAYERGRLLDQAE